MSITWKPGVLPQVIKALNEPGTFRTKMMKALGEEVLKLIQEEFNTRADPWRRAWAETQRPNPILEDTGRLRRSFRMESGPRTFRVYNATPYASFHQYGTRRLVSRKMIPDSTTSTELPRHWSEALGKVMVKRAKEWLTP